MRGRLGGATPATVKLLAAAARRRSSLTGAGAAADAAEARRLPGLPGVERLEPAGRQAAGRRRLGGDDRVDRRRRHRARRLRLAASTTARASASRTSSCTARRRRSRASRSTTRTRATRARTRFRPSVPIEGAPAHANDGDRHALIVDRDALQALRAVRAAHAGRPLGGGLRRDLEPALERAAAGGVDVGRRRRAADPARARALGRRRVDRSHRPRAALHGASARARAYIYPARHYASELDRSVAAADGAARAAEGERRHLAAAAAGAHRRPGDEDLRDDRRRQRLELVRRRARRARTGRTTSYTRSGALHGSDFEVVDTSKLRP